MTDQRTGYSLSLNYHYGLLATEMTKDYFAVYKSKKKIAKILSRHNYICKCCTTSKNFINKLKPYSWSRIF